MFMSMQMTPMSTAISAESSEASYNGVHADNNSVPIRWGVCHSEIAAKHKLDKYEKRSPDKYVVCSHVTHNTRFAGNKI